jgi:hypothetical protein
LHTNNAQIIDTTMAMATNAVLNLCVINTAPTRSACFSAYLKTPTVLCSCYMYKVCLLHELTPPALANQCLHTHASCHFSNHGMLLLMRIASREPPFILMCFPGQTLSNTLWITYCV